MPRTNIYEHSETYSFQVANKSYACVAFPITAIWGPAYNPNDEDSNPDWMRFSAGYRGTTDFVNTFRGPNSTLGAREKSYDYALKLLAAGYDILVKRADGLGNKATGVWSINPALRLFFKAKYPGSFGNELKVRFTNSGTTGVIEVFNRNHYFNDAENGEIVRTDQLLERVTVSLSEKSATDSYPFITEAVFDTLSPIILESRVELTSLVLGSWVVSLSGGTDYAVPESNSETDEQGRYRGIPLPAGMSINRESKIYYFKAPDDWLANKEYKNEGFDIGFYSNDSVTGPWPGQPAQNLAAWMFDYYKRVTNPQATKKELTAIEADLTSRFGKIYFAVCPKDAPLILWNNGIDGGMEADNSAKFAAAMQTVDIRVDSRKSTYNSLGITDLCGCLITETGRELIRNEYTQVTKSTSLIRWDYFDPRSGDTTSQGLTDSDGDILINSDGEAIHPYYDMDYTYVYDESVADRLDSLSEQISQMLAIRFKSNGEANFVTYFNSISDTLSQERLVQMWNQQKVFNNAVNMLGELTDPLIYDWDTVFMGIADDQYIPAHWKEANPDVDIQYQTTSAHLRLLEVAANSKCGAAFIGTPFGMKRGTDNELAGVATGAVKFKNDVSAAGGKELSTYGQVVGPWCRTTLPINGANSWVTPEVAHLLLMINAEGVGGQNKWWMVPAGMVGTGIVHSPEYRIKKAYLDLIQNHDSGVCMNPLMEVPGKGFTCFGNSTLWNKPLGTYNALQNLSTRLLTNRVKQRIWDTAIQILFKYNNENAYSHFYAGVSPLLDEMRSVGALQSTTANPWGYRITMNPDIINLDRINANTVIGKVELAVTGVIDTVVVDLFLLPPTAFQTEA